MFNYCITFNIFKTGNKTKINYGIVPCSLKSEEKKKYCFKSNVSNEIMENLRKKKNYYFLFIRKKQQIYFRIIFSSDKELEEAEKELIKKSRDALFKKIPFNLKLKSKINTRIERILM